MARSTTKQSQASTRKEIRPTLAVLTPPSREQIVGTLRDAFIGAPVGSHPSIPGLMRKYGLLDQEDTPTGGVTQSEVRTIALKEGWKAQREARLISESDLIPAEVRLGAINRAIEMRRMLGRLNDLTYRALNQYAQTGRVTTLDGSRDMGALRPESLAVGLLAEQRVLQSLMASLEETLPSAPGNGDLSPEEVRYHRRLKEMSPAQLRREVERLGALSRALDAKPEAITIEEIENQAEHP